MGIEEKENEDDSGDEAEKWFQIDVGVRSRVGIEIDQSSKNAAHRHNLHLLIAVDICDKDRNIFSLNCCI